MGERGPTPKRSNQRRRRNKPEVETTEAAGAKLVDQPRAKTSWHPAAKRWYEALAESGQARFYEPSDWALAHIIAESMSRDLKPRSVGVTDEGKVVTSSLPISGASLSSYLKAMTGLLVTEGDRRRAQVELTRPAVDEEAPENVSEIDEWRDRLHGGTG